MELLLRFFFLSATHQQGNHAVFIKSLASIGPWKTLDFGASPNCKSWLCTSQLASESLFPLLFMGRTSQGLPASCGASPRRRRPRHTWSRWHALAGSCCSSCDSCIRGGVLGAFEHSARLQVSAGHWVLRVSTHISPRGADHLRDRQLVNEQGVGITLWMSTEEGGVTVKLLQ